MKVNTMVYLYLINIIIVFIKKKYFSNSILCIYGNSLYIWATNIKIKIDINL